MTEEKTCTRLGREITDIDRAFDVLVRGVVVLTTRCDDALNGMSAAWVSKYKGQFIEEKVLFCYMNFLKKGMKTPHLK